MNAHKKQTIAIDGLILYSGTTFPLSLLASKTTVLALFEEEASIGKFLASSFDQRIGITF